VFHPGRPDGRTPLQFTAFQFRIPSFCSCCKGAQSVPELVAEAEQQQQRQPCMRLASEFRLPRRPAARPPLPSLLGKDGAAAAPLQQWCMRAWDEAMSPMRPCPKPQRPGRRQGIRCSRWLLVTVTGWARQVGEAHRATAREGQRGATGGWAPTNRAQLPSDPAGQWAMARQRRRHSAADQVGTCVQWRT